MSRRSLALLLLTAFFLLPTARAHAQAAETTDASNATEKKQIAVITTYYGARSHANALATKFFTGYPTDDGVVEPRMEVVSMYVDQPEPNDMAHQLEDKFDFKIYPTITGALKRGTDGLAVDGVIYIGVHGDYPRSHLNAKMYPHLRHLAEVFAVFDATGESVPVYCDKELGYRWGDAKWIYDRAKELDAPLMAGSTLPVVWRDPQIETPDGEKITEAVAVGYGPLNSYLLHTVEILQSMLENRAGGETGVKSVQCVRGEDFYEAAEQGRFSMALVEKACATIEAKKEGTFRENARDPLAIIITYHDGTRATAVSCGRYIGEHFGYAAKMADETVATEYAMPHDTVFAHFSYQFLNVEKMMFTGEPAWPAERHLLSNGIIDAAMRSLEDGSTVRQTPHLDIDYKRATPDFIRPTNPRPTGQSLGPWPPEGFEFTAWEDD